MSLKDFKQALNSSYVEPSPVLEKLFEKKEAGNSIDPQMFASEIFKDSKKLKLKPTFFEPKADQGYKTDRAPMKKMVATTAFGQSKNANLFGDVLPKKGRNTIVSDTMNSSLFKDVITSRGNNYPNEWQKSIKKIDRKDFLSSNSEQEMPVKKKIIKHYMNSDSHTDMTPKPRNIKHYESFLLIR